MTGQRLLSTSEMAGFFLRHPLEAEYVAKTKLAIAAGVYDWTQRFPDWFFGMIPPWGTQVPDSSYGNVTIFFGTDGRLYVSGFTDVNSDINLPAYVPPPFKCKNGSDPTFGICAEDFSFLYVIGFGLLAYVVYQSMRPR